jgi:hypothetical protein
MWVQQIHPLPAMHNLSNKTLLAGVVGAWLLAATVVVAVRPDSSLVARAAEQPAAAASR